MDYRLLLSCQWGENEGDVLGGEKGFIGMLRWSVHYLAIFLCLLLSPISYVLKKFGFRVFVTGTVIGHFTIEPETYLKEKTLKGESCLKVILLPLFKHFISKKPWALDACNHYLAHLWKQKFIVITNPLLAFFLYPILGGPFLKHPRIFKTHFICHYPNYWMGTFTPGKGLFDIQNAYYEKYPDFSAHSASLTIPEKDQEKGRAILSAWGMQKDDWFVCFNAREPGHYSHVSLSLDSFRNADVKTYTKALLSVIDRGGWCIRVGSPRMEDLPEPLRSHPKIIDYPHTEHVSPFMDVFLCANCRFFIGGASGITLLPGLFGVPSVVANLVPFGVLPPYPKDIAIQKRYFSHLKKRFLTIEEIFAGPLAESHDDQYFREMQIEFIDNTEEEIHEAVQEMMAKIEGSYLPDVEAELLNRALKRALPDNAWGKNFAGKLGDQYIKRHAESMNLAKENSYIGCATELLPNH